MAVALTVRGAGPRAVRAGAMGVRGLLLLAVLLRELADAVADPVLPGRQLVPARVDLVLDLLAPDRGVGRSGHGGARRERHAAGHQDRGNGDDGGLERQAVSAAGRVEARARAPAGQAPVKLRRQPAVEVFAHEVSSSVTTRDAPLVTIPSFASSACRARRATVSREPSVVSGTPSAAASSRLE